MERRRGTRSALLGALARGTAGALLLLLPGPDHWFTGPAVVLGILLLLAGIQALRRWVRPPDPTPERPGLPIELGTGELAVRLDSAGTPIELITRFRAEVADVSPQFFAHFHEPGTVLVSRASAADATRLVELLAGRDTELSIVPDQPGTA